jgi:hypothetical protein
LARWKRFAHRAAEVQALILLGLLYWLVVVPAGFIRRIGRRESNAPRWHLRAAAQTSIDDARRQF